MDGLKPGRIVYFRGATGELPAIVTKVWNDSGTINVYAFPDGSQANEPALHVSIPYSDVDEAFTWHWMFDGQATRYQPDRVERP